MHTPYIYEGIVHPRVVNKLHLEDDKNLMAEQQDAQFLEDCFNDIKRISIGDMNPNWSAISGILTEDMINSLNSYGIFKYIGAPRHGAANQGVAFEQDLARIITEILFSLSGEQIVEENIGQFMESILSGTKSAYLNKSFNTSQVANMLGVTVKQLAKMTDRELSSIFKKAVDERTGEPFYTLVGRAGVTDINVANGATLTYNFEPNPTLERLFTILSTASFSAKNYLIDSALKGINLGLSTDIRFMSSSLSYVGFDEDDIGSLYGRTRNYQKSKKRGYDIVMQHLRHLRFAYELMGIGQSTGEAKFLIVNQRLMTGTEMGKLSKILKKDFFRDTKRGEIRVFSNRWLVGQLYNALLDSQVNAQGNIILINNIDRI